MVLKPDTKLKQRAKSVDKANKLPPAITQESRDRAAALKRAYERPRTAHRNARPETSNYNLPNFTNGRVNSSTIARRIGSTMKRSQSESKNLTRVEYGRSPSRERLDDLRDELHHAKKQMAVLEVDKKKMQTQLHRVLRDSDKRERYLERLVTSKFQPAELNDTHMARTLTAIQRNEITKEQIIQMQAKELELLRRNITAEPSSSSNEKPPTHGSVPNDASPTNYESDFTEQSDYPEEPAQIKTNGILKTAAAPEVQPSSKERNAKKREEHERKKAKESEKMKQKLVIARQYAEQNAKLKERLKELKNSYVEVQERNKKKDEDIRKKEDELKKHLMSLDETHEQKIEFDELQKAKELLVEEKSKTDVKIEDLNQELREAYGEIDALKMENEHLHNVIGDLENRVVSMTGSNGSMIKPIFVPRLDMTQVDFTDSVDLQTGHSATSISSLSNIDDKTMARAMAEIAGAHIERMLTLQRLDTKNETEVKN